MTESLSHAVDGSTVENDEILQVVSFTLGEEVFGLDILKVQEINRMTAVTRIPNTPECVDGVINLRGRVIPVIDLRCRLGMDRKTHDSSTRIVVIEVEGTVAGFIVDAVQEVLRIPKSLTEAPPSLTGRVRNDMISGVGKVEDRLLILLDLHKVVFDQEMESVN
ncbi:MAG TPA: chemotaxis protein CheW [Bacteroidota bacterium]|nr:chemotaxis protein CheW [Bacteroidota bacterium]